MPTYDARPEVTARSSAASVSSSGVVVGPDVHLPQVDVVDAEPAQRGVEGAQQVAARGVVRAARRRGARCRPWWRARPRRGRRRRRAACRAAPRTRRRRSRRRCRRGCRRPRRTRCSWSRASCSSVSRPHVMVPRPEPGDLEPGAAERALLHGRERVVRSADGRRPPARRWTGAVVGSWPVSDFLKAVVLGIIQGLTEFLPISSSAHLRIFPELFGWGDPGAAFTAVIQIGTELAVLIYFRKDIWRIASTWLRSLVQAGVPRPPRRPDGLVHHHRLAADRGARRRCSRTSSSATSATCGSSAPR